MVKRIPLPANFEQLKQQAAALFQNKPVMITYVDSVGDTVEVVDNSDFELSVHGKSAITYNLAPFSGTSMQPQPSVSVQPVIEEVINTSAKVIEEETKEGKKGKKAGGNKGLNRKALKNLIQQELQTQSKDIFREILKSPIEGIEEPKEPVSKEPMVHEGIRCDGCDTVPVTGIRYKCSVCKDFDYCANCEERLSHEHPFLKIKNPANVPEVMITILPENYADEKTQPQGEQQRPFGFNGRGGRCGGRGGHGGFKRMASQFLEQMGLNFDDVKKQFCEMKDETEGGCGGKKKMFKQFLEQNGVDVEEIKKQFFGNTEWKKNDGNEGCGWARKDWNLKRVEVVDYPQHVLEGSPG